MSDVEQKTVYQREAYAIRDLKANVFTAPFVAGTVDEARRIFGDMCYFGGDNLIARHPSDYELYHVGYFDISTGLISPCTALPVRIISAQEIISVYRSLYSKQLSDNSELNSELSDLSQSQEV